MIAGQLEIQLAANVAQLVRDMDTAKRTVGSAMDSISGAVSTAKKALEGLGVIGAADYLKNLAAGAINAQAHLDDLSKSTAITVEQLAGLKLAAQVSGSDIDTVATSVNRLSANVGKNTDAFRALGISTKDPLQALEQLADVLSGIQDPALRAAVASQALGKGWQSMAPLLNQGSAKIKELVDEGTRLSNVTSQSAASANELNRHWEELVGTGGLLNTVMNKIVPVLDLFVKAATKVRDSGFAEYLERTVRSMVPLPIQAVAIAIGQYEKNASKAATTSQEFAKWAEAGDQVSRRQANDAAAAAKNFLDYAANQEAAKKAAEELAKHEAELRKKDLEGWVAYAQAQLDEWDQTNTDLAKISDDFFKHEEDLRTKDNAGWVAYAQQQVDEYEQSLKDLGDKQPSFFEASQQMWKGYVDGIDSGFRDAWNSFVDGSGNAAQAARSALKRTLFDWIYQQFAKPIILNVVGNLAGIMGLSGLSLAAQAAGGGGGSSLLSTGSSILSLGSTVAGATGASSLLFGTAGSAGVAYVDTLGGMGAMGAAGMTGGVAATSGLIGTGGEMAASGIMSGVTSALASIPVYGWIALAVIAIAAWLGGKGGGPKTGGSFFGAFDASGNLTGTQAVPGTDNGRFFTPSDSDTQMQQAGQSFATGYVNTVRALGGTASAFTAGLGIDNDPRGTAQSRVSSMLQMGGSTIFSATNVGVDDKAVPAEVQHQIDQMLLAALQHSDLPPEVLKVLNSITDVASATDDQIQAVLKQAQEMAAVVQGLKSINLHVTVEDLQAMAASGETIGQTFQRVAGQIASFDSAFMDDGQKLAAAQKQITDAFGSLGLAIPSTASQFYDLVHGLDLSTESGRSAFNVLMQIAPVFQSVQQAGVAMTSALTSALNTLGNSGFGRAMTQGSLSNAASQFRSTHPFAAGWSDTQLVQQLQTISPSDWANYLANDPSGANLITTILTAAASLAGSAAPAASSFSNSVGNAASAASNLAGQLDQAKASLGQFLNSLLTNQQLSPLSPLDQQEAARQTWVADLQAAAGGDVSAYGRLQGDATTLLGIARQNYGSSSTYVDLFNVVYSQMAKLAGVPDYNTKMLDIQTQTRDTLKDAVSVLTTVSASVVAVGNKISAAVASSGDKVATAVASTWATR